MWKLKLLVVDGEDKPVLQASWAMANDEAVQVWSEIRKEIEKEIDWMVERA